MPQSLSPPPELYDAPASTSAGGADSSTAGAATAAVAAVAASAAASAEAACAEVTSVAAPDSADAGEGTPKRRGSKSPGAAAVTQMLGLADDESFASLASVHSDRVSEGDVLATSRDLPGSPGLPPPPAASTVRVSQPASAPLAPAQASGGGGSGGGSAGGSTSGSTAQLRSPMVASLRIDVAAAAPSTETAAPACASRDATSCRA